MNATITSTAHYVPEKVLTNSDLEKLVDTSDEWIKSSLEPFPQKLTNINLYFNINKIDLKTKR